MNPRDPKPDPVINSSSKSTTRGSCTGPFTRLLLYMFVVLFKAFILQRKLNNCSTREVRRGGKRARSLNPQNKPYTSTSKSQHPSLEFGRAHNFPSQQRNLSTGAVCCKASSRASTSNEVWTCGWACVYIYIYIYMYVYTHVCMCVHMYTYIYIYVAHPSRSAPDPYLSYLWWAWRHY